MKTIAIHQPNFMPYIGYFDKMMACDVFVFLDDVQFATDHFINRNRIKTPQGEQWLTVPIRHTGQSGQRQRICDVEIAEEKWKKKMVRSIERNYSKTPWFEWNFRDLEALIDLAEDKLVDLNINLVGWVMRKLGVYVHTVMSSEMGLNGEVSTERLVAICQELEADCYLSGSTGKKYMDESLFEQAGIKVAYQEFKHPTYSQVGGDFLPDMSVIDLLMNCGPQSRHIITEGE